MCFSLTVLVLLILALALLPLYPYSRAWGYFPSGTVIALLVLLALFWWFALLPPWYQSVPP